MTSEIQIKFNNMCNMCKKHSCNNNICKSCKNKINKEVLILHILYIF